MAGKCGTKGILAGKRGTEGILAGIRIINGMKKTGMISEGQTARVPINLSPCRVV